MLVIKKELDVQDFKNEFHRQLKDLSLEGVEMVFDSLCNAFYDGADEMQIRDYLRFQMQVMSLEEVIDSYGYDMDLEDLEDDELIEAVENYLNDNTYLIGSYEEDDTIYFIFDEF